MRCLGPKEARYVLEEIHEGVCGNHISSRSLAHKTLRQGYFWLTMKNDSQELVQKCEKCQKFARTLHQSPENLSPIVATWLFAQWGIDIFGPLPKAKAQEKFVIVAVEYFTKWPEAEVVATIT